MIKREVLASSSTGPYIERHQLHLLLRIMSTNAADEAVPPTESGLKKAIRLPHAAAMVIGIIVGASIFVQPTLITGRVPSVRGIFLVWALSGVLTLFGALVCAELASVFPRSGGVYVFLR